MGLVGYFFVFCDSVGFAKDFQTDFIQGVRPVVEEYCVRCHGPEKRKAKFDMDGFRSSDDVVADYKHFELALERLESGEMPPEDEPRPDALAVKGVRAWFDGLTDEMARRDAGDPGNVLARRLSGSEYNYTIRDLTGVDLEPAKDFPVDAANQAGFDNSGESLLMSPGLFSKYIGAARDVSEHLYLHPQGFGFASHPVVTEVDRDRFCVHRIVDFYKRREINLADYVECAWRFENREDRTLGPAGFARSQGVSEKYFERVISLLGGEVEGPGPVKWLRERFLSLPAPEDGEDLLLRERCEEMAERVLRSGV